MIAEFKSGPIARKEKPRMGIKSRVRDAMNSLVQRYGYTLVQSRLLYEWQRNPQIAASYRQSPLPQDAKAYLQKTNPMLRDLQARYAAFNSEATTPLVWTDAHVSDYDILFFRGDNAYVWQLRGVNMNVMAYALTTYYVNSIDVSGLIESLAEDESFGNFTFEIDNKRVSRDLLDSIIEIQFLERHLDISRAGNLTMLDIGAGYGRLAHRVVSALPNVAEYICTDTHPISSFVSDYYLRYRGLEGRAKVVPLDEIEDALQSRTVDIAVNIHSFSECRTAAIAWWLALLEKQHVRYLMIVPNSDYEDSGEVLRTNDGIDFTGLVEKHGYRLVAKEPKYRDPVVQAYAINPTYHHLFELR